MPDDVRFKSFFERLSPAAAVYCMFFGVMVITGWVFNIAFLKNPIPGQFPISPAVAFCFFSAGFALFRGRPGKKNTRTILRVVASVILAVLVMIALPYVTGGTLDLERYLFPYPIGGVNEFAPGRMSTYAAVGWLLASASLFFLSLEQKWFSWAQRTACFMGLLGYFVMVGYIYNLPMLYSTSSFTRIALLAGFAFVLLALAVIFYRPFEGLASVVTKTGPASVLVRRLLPAALIVPIGLGSLKYFAEHLGWLQGEAGSVFMVVADTVVMLALIGITSSAITALDKDRQRLKEQKDKFISVLIHDLEDPLLDSERFLDGFRSVRLDTLTVEQQGLFDFLTATNAELMQKIRNLFEFHRLEKEEGESGFKTVNIVPAVQRVCEKFQGQAKAQKKQIIVTLPESMPEVMGDEAALEQVLANLLQNALKFTNAGGSIELSVNALKFLVDIQVRDNGKGMSAEDQEKLFKAFNRGVAGGQVPSGTGLGLYLCDQIVKAHNGHLTCMSEVDQGTTFVMTLPLAAGAESPKSAAPLA